MIWAGFFVGLLGSMHCVGMCGPIALSLPIPKEGNRISGILLYNFGRVFTYALIGLLFGLFGSIFVLAGLQKFLSIIAGILLLVMAIMYWYGDSIFKIRNPISSLMLWLKNTLGYYLKQYSMSTLFVVGLLNGLLPCGLVYVALIGAVAMGDSLMGSYYMMLFGFGTIPLMFIVAYAKNMITIRWRNSLMRAVPFFVGLMGLVLILRGMNLGIPYLSPEISSVDLKESTCCSSPKPTKVCIDK